MSIVQSSIARHFGTVAPYYRQLRDLDVRAVHLVCHKLQGLAEAACDVAVLDVGAGTGRYTEAVLNEIGHRVGRRYHGVAYDAVREMLGRGPAHRVVRGGNIDRTIGVAETLPFAAQSFRAVMSFNAVHHFDLRAFLAEAARVLEPGGKLVVYTRTPEQNRRTIWGEFFPQFTERETRLFTEAQLRAAVDGPVEFGSVEFQEVKWTIRTTASRLTQQARSRYYSTFSLYTPGELQDALRVFEHRLRARFDDPSAITAQNDHLLVVGTRH